MTHKKDFQGMDQPLRWRPFLEQIVLHLVQRRLCMNMVTTGYLKQNNKEKSPYLSVNYSSRVASVRSGQIKACVDSQTEQTVCGE